MAPPLPSPADPVARVPLFGGAMTALLPVRLADVAAARPVPDHQEVWADPEADESLVVEIVVRGERERERENGFFGSPSFFDSKSCASPPHPPFAPFFQERAAVADADAAAFFFRDLASANDAEHGAVLTSTTVLPRAAVPALPADGAAVAAVGAMAVAKGRAGPPNDVAVHLAVLRFPTVASDVLVSVTTATRVHPASAAAERAGAGARPPGAVEGAGELLAGVLASLEVRDWGLFGEGGG